MDEKLKHVLEKQIDLLSKQQESACNISDIIALSHEIAEIAKLLIYPICYQEVVRASRQC